MLGVRELADHSLRALSLPHPQDLVEEFWQGVNDPKTVSANLLSPEDVSIVQVDGKNVVVIFVPKADPAVGPVYIGNDPFTGTYKRNGEGDFRCSKEEVQAMLDAASPRK